MTATTIQQDSQNESWYQQHEFIFLLVVQLVYLSTLPIVYELSGLIHPTVGKVIIVATFWALVLTTAATIMNECSDPRAKWLIGGLATGSIGAEIAFLLTHATFLEYLAIIGWTILLILTVVLIVVQIFHTHHVTFNTVCASVTVYVMFGVIWAQLYTMVELVRPNSFTIPLNPSTESMGADLYHASITTMYYSFVTLTTLGMGDITPVKPITRMLTIVETLVGQLYLVVMVARFVGMYTTDSPRARE